MVIPKYALILILLLGGSIGYCIHEAFTFNTSDFRNQIVNQTISYSSDLIQTYDIKNSLILYRYTNIYDCVFASHNLVPLDIPLYKYNGYMCYFSQYDIYLNEIWKWGSIYVLGAVMFLIGILSIFAYYEDPPKKLHSM